MEEIRGINKEWSAQRVSDQAQPIEVLIGVKCMSFCTKNLVPINKISCNREVKMLELEAGLLLGCDGISSGKFLTTLRQSFFDVY